MPSAKLTQDIINAAIEGFESQKSRIDARIAELRQMLTGSVEATATPVIKRGRRKLSAAARARIAEAQRKRWAAQKQAAQSIAEPKTAPAKPKRKLSAAGRRAIIEATKKRWARVRAEAAKPAASPRGSKKTAPKKGPVGRARSKGSAKPGKKGAGTQPQQTTAPVSVPASGPATE